MRVSALLSRTLAAIRGGSRRRKATIIVGLAVGVFAVAVGSALGVLAGSPSKFEANDGNMIVNTAGNNDWASVTGSAAYEHLTDPSDTSDDSFDPGQKQDTTCPDVAPHPNPPKDDFTDIARFSEISNTGSTFLYGATIRVAPNGNASENIELKQGTGNPKLCPGSTTLLQRVAGDKLIAIDYLNGGTNVQFNVLTWVTSGACFVSSHTAPCWGATVQSLSANAAEGQASQSDIAAADNSINGLALSAGQFAEFGINLTAAGIIPANACSPFTQTIWESRASGSSFVSTTKDVVVDNLSLSNCGEIKIIKHTNPRGLNQQFQYTSGSASTLKLPQIASGGACNGVNSTGGFCLNDNGNTTGDNTANTVDETNLPQGTYTVTEGSDPTGFAFASVTCSPSGHTSVSGRTVTINLAPNDVITCTYVNDQQLGAIKITKTSSKAAATPLAGAHFSICTNSTGTCTPAKTGSGDLQTGANGTVCIDGLTFGDYYVTETAPPNGYKKDDSSTHTVTVSHNASCSDATFAGESIGFTDTPLTDVLAKAQSEATGGTQSRVTCVDSSNANVGNSPQPSASTFADPAQVTANGLSPGTYTCTIVIDP
jgi:hypothetical protein